MGKTGMVFQNEILFQNGNYFCHPLDFLIDNKFLRNRCEWFYLHKQSVKLPNHDRRLATAGTTTKKPLVLRTFGGEIVMANDSPKIPKGLTIFMAAVPLLWLLSALAIYIFTPNWQTRGLIGDMFGVANSLFSALALVGLVYTLFLQQRQLEHQRIDSIESQKSFQMQLKEMQLSRMQAAQPLPIVTLKKITAEKPRLFYTPPEDKYSVISKYRVEYSVSNNADYPAVNVDIKSVIILPENDSKHALNSIAHRFNILIKTAMKEKPSQRSFSYHEKEGRMRFLDCLRSGNPSSISMLFMRVTYKNMLGSCFGITQGYYLDLTKSEQDKDIAAFQTTLRTFPLEFKNEIEQLRHWKKANNDEKWVDLFSEIKKKIGAKDGPSEIALQWNNIPEYSKFEILDESIFTKEQDESFYGHPIPVLSRHCAASDDTDNKTCKD